MIIDFAEKIYHWLNTHDRHMSILLNDSIPENQIDELCSSLPIKLPKELKKIYQWHNGTVNEKGYTYEMLSFFPGFFLISLQEAIDNYHSFIKDDRWNKMWFPVFANGGGDFFVIECSEHRMLDESCILGFIIDYEEVEIEYLSLTKMFETIYLCYKEGAYYIDEDNCLEINVKKEAVIANKRNPNLDRWLGELQ